MITRYVNTASSAGGDGTTNATTGDSRAYASLNEFEASEQAVLSDSIEAICEGSSADGTKVIIDGWTTTSSYYIYIHTTQANRHDGKWNTGKYRLDFSDAWDHVIDCNANHARFEGLQLYNSNAISMGFKYQGTGELYFNNNILKSTSYDSAHNSLHLDSMGVSTVKIWNNILYNLKYGIYFDWGAAGSTFYIYNNTIVDILSDGVHIHDSVGDCSLYLKNNLVFNTATDYVLVTYTTRDYDYNMGEDAAFAGDSNYVQTTQIGTSIFEDYNNDDFHIKTGSDAKDAGTSSVSPINFTDDIDGDTRSGSWDIGADEYVAGGETFYKTIVGIFPNPDGTVSTILLYRHSVYGNVPNMTSSIVKDIGKGLAGSCPGSEGSIIRSTDKNLAGSQPSTTASLDATTVQQKSTLGNIPEPGATLSSKLVGNQSIFGNIPNAVGVIVKRISKYLVGSQPTFQGIIVKSTGKYLTGNQPNATSNVKRKIITKKTGIMGAISGAVSSILNPVGPGIVKLYRLIGSSLKKFIG